MKFHTVCPTVVYCQHQKLFLSKPQTNTKISTFFPLCLQIKKKLVPADGIKGKTWGPSTLHQNRVRGNLPALSQTSTQDPLHFSKSAPNLDKSRPAADSPTNATSTHNNFLGKSVDGLNIINKTDTKNNNNYSNSTKLGSVDQLNNGNRYANFNDLDEDDDEDVASPGCFSFIGGHVDHTLLKRKKHSLDSKIVETNPNPNSNPMQALHIAVKSIGTAAYNQEVGVDDENSRRIVDLDKADYDRVFYRKMQKSLDDISMNYGHFQNHNQPLEREDFLVDPRSMSSDNENDSSFDAGISTNQDFSQKSIDSFTEQNPNDSGKFSSGEIFGDEQNNSSSDTASTSRKNSVTFRDDNVSAQYSLLSDASNESTKNYANTKITGNYAIIQHPTSTQSNISSILNVATTQANATPKKERKEKPSFIKWRVLPGKKTPKTDMNQQLLD